MKKSLALRYQIIACAFSLAFLIPATAWAQSNDVLTVGVSDPIIGDWVKAIGGDKVAVVILNKNERSLLFQVDIIYQRGLGSEPWLDEANQDDMGSARYVVLSDGLKTMPQNYAYWQDMPPPHPHTERMPPCCKADALESNKEWTALIENVKFTANEDAGNQTDPNVWFSVNNAMTMVVNINETLVEIDPSNAEFYDANTYTYLRQLDELDDEIKATIQDIPAKQRQIITKNDSFRYFAQRYGLIAIPENDAGGKQTVIAEWTSETYPAENNIIIDATDTHTANANKAQAYLYTTIVSTPNSPAKDYPSLMRNNAKLIATHLTQ